MEGKNSNSFEFKLIKLEHNKERYIPLHVEQDLSHIAFLAIKENNIDRGKFSLQ